MFKAAAILMGAVIGIGLFAMAVRLLFAKLLKEIIEPTVRNCNERDAH